MPRPSKLPFEQVAQWATLNVATHPKDFTHALAEHFGVSRAAAATVVRELESDGFVRRSGGATRPLFAAGPTRWISRTRLLNAPANPWEQA